MRRQFREGFRDALRFLARCNEGLTPTPRDLIILRRLAKPSEEKLPVEEICYRLIGREFARESVPREAGRLLTEMEKQALRDLAASAIQLVRLRDQKRISDAEYIERLNVLRGEHGLWPLQLPVPRN